MTWLDLTDDLDLILLMTWTSQWTAFFRTRTLVCVHRFFRTLCQKPLNLHILCHYLKQDLRRFYLEELIQQLDLTDDLTWSYWWLDLILLMTWLDLTDDLTWSSWWLDLNLLMTWLDLTDDLDLILLMTWTSQWTAFFRTRTCFGRLWVVAFVTNCAQ